VIVCSVTVYEIPEGCQVGEGDRTVLPWKETLESFENTSFDLTGTEKALYIPPTPNSGEHPTSQLTFHSGGNLSRNPFSTFKDTRAVR